MKRRKPEQRQDYPKGRAPKPENGLNKKYLLVDGYNIIFAWDELKKLAEESLEAARIKLADILCNYQGCNKSEVILVFDAHKVKDGQGSVERYHNINIVFTKEAQTADNYIEWASGMLSRNYEVRVATSDNLEQVIIMGKGALRVSASELHYEIMEMERKIRKGYILNRPVKNNMLLDNLDPQTAELLEKMRREG